MNSPTRRILGQKDANTHLSHTHQTLASSVNMKSATEVENGMRKPSVTSSKNITPASHKRKIDEVEDAERVERTRPSDSQQTLLLDDSESEMENEDVSMSTFQRSYETAGTSFLGSQNAVEPQFEIQQDEMSQRTLDKLNAVPLPQNTSQLPPWQPTLPHDVSAGSIGLSAYFNLDDQASTQGSDGLQMIETLVKVQAHENNQETSKQQDVISAPKSTPVSQKDTLPSIIEAAKTRLQLAMYKVQTKQVHKPFSRLKHEPLQLPGLVGTPRFVPPLKTATSHSTSSDATIALEIYNRDLQSSRDNAEAGIVNLREQGEESDTGQMHHRHRSKSVVTDSCKNSQSTDLGTQNFLSSPPLSRQHSTDSLEELLPPNNTTAFTQQDSQGSRKQAPSSSQSQPQQQQQLSSPPISDSGQREKSVSSKVQRIGQGEAATGLLQLMTGGAGLCGV